MTDYNYNYNIQHTTTAVQRVATYTNLKPETPSPTSNPAHPLKNCPMIGPARFAELEKSSL